MDNKLSEALLCKIDTMMKDLQEMKEQILLSQQDAARFDDMDIWDFEFSTRATRALEAAGIRTVGEVRRMSKTAIIEIPNCGARTLADIEDAFRAHNIKF